MPAEYKQVGDRLMYRNTGSATLPAKSVVVFGDCVGVTLNDIAPGMEGPAQLTGVWACDGTMSAPVTRGTKVYFDPASSMIVDSDADGAVAAGILARDAVAGAGQVEVKINA